MGSGKLKFEINGETYIAEYEVKIGFMRLKLITPYTISMVFAYNTLETDEKFNKGYATYELGLLLQKVLFVESHKQQFETVISEYNRLNINEDSVESIGIFNSLMEKYIKDNEKPVGIATFWINPTLLSDILNGINQKT